VPYEQQPPEAGVLSLIVNRVQSRLLLLLPEKLEDFSLRPLVEELLQTGAAIAVDPPRTSYRRLARIPDAIGVSIAHKQARRLRRRLRGEDPRAIAIFAPDQYPLARGLLVLMPDCELWYEHSAAIPRGDARTTELHALAAERAAVRFTADDLTPLREALASLY
jgi:hypothetical protein